jgi:exodeoxyribonuclease V gamma subunit
VSVGSAGDGADHRLTVRYAARVEDLRDALVDRLRGTSPPDPFEPITIVVQSRGMQRWLSHQLAQRLDPAGGGIAANLVFPFPGRLFRELATACLDGQPDPEEDPWQPDRLVWEVLASLVAHRGRPELTRLDRYLAADGMADGVVERRTYRFARGIADVFDGYALARPEMVAAWSEGRAVGPDLGPLDPREAWQPWLWRELVERLAVDPERRTRAVIDALSDPRHETTLPPRLTTVRSFGISALPPVQLELLGALATCAQVELYVPTTSLGRWEAVGAAVAAHQPRPAPRHPLLAASGRVGDDAAEMFHRGDATLVPVGPGPDRGEGLLEALQEGLRQDRVPMTEDERLPLDPADRSVRIHRCYGPARQAEVLRDVLLGLLADEPGLQPRDVLVMTPDIATFAPLVQAAFVGTADVPELPVRVADRHLGVSNPVAEALEAILELVAGRATATQVLDLLGREPVARRFGLTPEVLEQAATWISDTGIHWGIDRADRTRHGQPPDRVHTWRFGLDRLLLGVTMADEDHRIVGDVAPYDHVEGDDVIAVGRFAAACRTLFTTAEKLREPRPLDAWRDALVDAMDRCLDVEQVDRWRVQEVRRQLDALADGGRGAGQLELDLGAIRTALSAAVDEPRGAAGYETGAITVCELIPMRSIPHEVVCLLGLDDGRFPRQDRRPGFDLLERHDAVGDRDKRVEDRALFVEAVAAARRHLVVTTTGWDVRTGEDRPPAVPLAELREVIDRTAVADGERASDAVTVDHPLHPFSPTAFDPARPDGPSSFDPVTRDAAELVRRRDRRSTPLLAGELPEITPDHGATEVEPVTLRELTEAVTHPTRYLLQHRLDVHLREHVAEVDDLEPVQVDGRRRWRLGSEALVDGMTPAWADALLASGAVPAGTPGRAALADISGEVDQLRSMLASTAGRLGLPGHRDALTDGDRRGFELSLDGRRLAVHVDGLHDVGGRTLRLAARFVRRRHEQLLEAWLVHLALTAAGTTDLVSIVVARGGSSGSGPHVWRLGPLDTDPDAAIALAERHLTALAEVHAAAARQLLPLFPHASPRYVEKGTIAAARDAFAPEFSRAGDGDRDEYVREVYGAEVSLDDVLRDQAVRRRFQELAHAVWGPAIGQQEATDLDALAAP